MDSTLLKRNLSGLLSMTNNLPRLIEEMEKILVEIKPCNHEDGGVMYPSLPPQFKCTKCGEFYRL